LKTLPYVTKGYIVCNSSNSSHNIINLFKISEPCSEEENLLTLGFLQSVLDD